MDIFLKVLANVLSQFTYFIYQEIQPAFPGLPKISKKIRWEKKTSLSVLQLNNTKHWIKSLFTSKITKFFSDFFSHLLWLTYRVLKIFFGKLQTSSVKKYFLYCIRFKEYISKNVLFYFTSARGESFSSCAFFLPKFQMFLGAIEKKGLDYLCLFFFLFFIVYAIDCLTFHIKETFKVTIIDYITQ